MDQTPMFRQARPVWVTGQETDKNRTVRFSVLLSPSASTLTVTASTLYRLFVNGKLAAYGPARGPRGFFRADEIALGGLASGEETILVIEVAGYNVNSYYTLDQPSFLWAEIRDAAGTVLAATGRDGDFIASPVPERIQKVQRYSFQRPFGDAWSLTPSYGEYFHRLPSSRLPLTEQDPKPLLPRRAALPTLTPLVFETVVGRGRVSLTDSPQKTFNDRSLVSICDTLKGFSEEELTVSLSRDADRYVYHPDPSFSAFRPGAESLPRDTYLTYGFPVTHSGFVSLHVSCRTAVTLVAVFDEILQNGDVDWHRMGQYCNVIRWDLAPGTYDLLTFETYTMQGLKIAAFGGDAVLSDVSLIEYATSAPIRPYPGTDPRLKKIYDAAAESFRQNAVDLFNDCPSRERAGWLCDSFWTARAEYALTGTQTVNRAFLENFLLPESFPHLPDGMLPGCYPADHYDGLFIVDWAMWFVLQLNEYDIRTGDREMTNAFRPRLYKLIGFLEQYRDEFGLLERLPGWNFIDWSKANQFGHDVNFPINMLYARVLDDMGRMYGDPALTERAAALRRTVLEWSFDGTFFVDNARRDENNRLVLTANHSEVCQYYAFYFDIVSPETCPALYETLLSEFGPVRDTDDRHPDVLPTTAFFGYQFRIELLLRWGLTDPLKETLSAYYSHMAEATGTLWEYERFDHPYGASMVHGFESNVAAVIAALEKAK